MCVPFRINETVKRLVLQSALAWRHLSAWVHILWAMPYLYLDGELRLNIEGRALTRGMLRDWAACL